jgi:hypothetical protein
MRHQPGSKLTVADYESEHEEHEIFPPGESPGAFEEQARKAVGRGLLRLEERCIVGVAIAQGF